MPFNSLLVNEHCSLSFSDLALVDSQEDTLSKREPSVLRYEVGGGQKERESRAVLLSHLHGQSCYLTISANQMVP